MWNRGKFTWGSPANDIQPGPTEAAAPAAQDTQIAKRKFGLTPPMSAPNRSPTPIPSRSRRQIALSDSFLFWFLLTPPTKAAYSRCSVSATCETPEQQVLAVCVWGGVGEWRIGGGVQVAG